MSLNLFPEPADTPAIGDNQPPPPQPLSPPEIYTYLEYAAATVLERLTQVMAVLRADAEVPITDDDILGAVAEHAKAATALERAFEALRKETKEPFLDGGRAVDGWFLTRVEPLKALRSRVDANSLTYLNTKRRAAEAKAAEEARKAREELADAERKAREAASLDPFADDAPFAALAEAQEHADKAAAAAEAKPADATRTYSDAGVATSIKRRWSWRVANFAAVPREFLTVDAAKVRAAMSERDQNSGKPTAVIPGIEWMAEDSINRR